MIVCRSTAELERMREAGRLVGEVLTALTAKVAPGVTTAELDALAEKRILRAGATPAFKGYHGYPATICASINDEVIHGIPSGRRVLNEGDIVSIDVGASLDDIMAGRALLIIVDIVVPESELVRRLSFRQICAECGATATPGNRAASVNCTKCGGPLIQRADDTDAVVLERLGVYRRDTKPLVEYYRVRPTFCSINGAQAPDRVTADIASAVEAAVSRGARAAEGQTR